MNLDEFLDDIPSPTDDDDFDDLDLFPLNISDLDSEADPDYDPDSWITQYLEYDDDVDLADSLDTVDGNGYDSFEDDDLTY